MTDDSVYLIAAKRLSREGLRRILLDSSFTVIHEASSIEDALPFIESLQPSLVLVDLSDGGEIRSEHTGWILAAAPRVRIVVLTGAIQGHRLADALSAGVDGYLQNSMSSEALHQSQAHQQDRCPDADRVIRWQQPDQKRADADQHQRDDQNRFASDAIAKMTEYHAAKRSREKTDAEARER